MSFHVRDVLESAREAAPAPRTTTDDIIARARRMRARRTAAAVTGSTAAFLAVVAAAAYGLGSPGPEAGPTAMPPLAAQGPAVADGPLRGSLLTPPETFSTVLGEYRVGPYRIGPVGAVTAGFQELPVYFDGQTWGNDKGESFPLSDGLITVYRPGVFDPDALGADESYKFGPAFGVTVAGRAAIGREVTDQPAPSAGAGPSSSPGRAGEGYVRTALAWQYEPGAWATYVPKFMMRSESTQDAVRVVEAVKPQEVKQVRVPYRLDSLPAGWQTVSVTETTAAMSDLVSEVFVHNGPLPRENLAGKVDLRLPSIHVVVMTGDPKDETIRGKDGVHCYSPQPACTLIRDGHFIDVDARGTDLTVAEVRKFVDGLKPVDVTKHDKWLPVTR